MVGVLAGAGLLAGCGGGDRSSSGGTAEDSAAKPAPAPAEGFTSGQSQQPSKDQGSAAGSGQGGSADRSGLARVVPDQLQQQLIRKADLSVRVKDVTAAAKEARRRVAAAQGMVFSEQSSRSPDGGGGADEASVHITFKVPPDQLDGLMSALGDLGTPLSTNISTEDVTDQVVDVAARIRSQQESVERVRALLARARTLGEVVQVESQLTSRIADLEALESKQKALATQVAQATLSLTLSGPGQPAPAKPEDKDESGFLAGLRGGWHAFAATVSAVLTAVGALLPFLVLVALLWLPGRWVFRQVRRRLAGRDGQLTPPEAGPAPSA